MKSDEGMGDYLEAGFDPSVLTKPQLRSILAENGVTDLPPASTRKEVLVGLFARHIGERRSDLLRRRNVAPSARGIAFLDKHSQPSPKRSPARSSSPSTSKGSSARDSPSKGPSSVSSPSKAAARGTKKRSQSRGRARSTEQRQPSTPSPDERPPSPSSRAGRAVAEERASQNPLHFLAASLPKYSDSAESATAKLHDRLAYIANVNKLGRAASVLTRERPRPLAATSRGRSTSPRRARSSVWSKAARLWARLCGWLLSLAVTILRLVLVTGTILAVGLYLRYKFVYQLDYCPVPQPSPPVASHRSLQLSSLSIEHITTALKTICIPCPRHATCVGGRLRCDDGFIPRDNLIVLGRRCETDRRKLLLIDALEKDIKRGLAEHAARVICGGGSSALISEPSLSEQQLRGLLLRNNPTAPWNNAEYGALFRAAINDIRKNPAAFDIRLAYSSARRRSGGDEGNSR